MAMAAGFKTHDGTLYWIDPQGGTHRLARSAGFDGVAARHACVYIAGPQARAISTTRMRVSLTCLEGGILVDCRDAAHLARVWARGDLAGVSITDEASRVAAGGAPGVRHPSIGLYPFEQVMTREGLVNRLGQPIIQLYNSTADLVGAGFPWGHMARWPMAGQPRPPRP